MARECAELKMIPSTTITVGDAPVLSNSYLCKGMKEGTFFLNVSAIKAGGTADLQVIINSYDPASGSSIQLDAFTSTAIVGTEVIKVTSNLGWKIEAEASVSGGAAGDTLTFTVGGVLKD